MTCERLTETAAWISSIAIAIGGCASDPDSELVTVDNSGAVCLSPSGDRTVVRVVFRRCLSPGCDVPQTQTCNAIVAGDRIEVSSHLEYTSPTSNRSCDDVCERESAACGTITLPNGTYRLVHGAEEAELVVPLGGPQSLFAEAIRCD